MKKQLLFFILVFFFSLFFWGCEDLATLFHGSKPEDPPVTYTVTFDANGATGTTPVMKTVNEGEAIILPDKESLNKIGYIFIGWNENSNGIGTTYSVGASITVTRNIVFYAQWLDSSTPQYTVTFNANGATSGSPPDPQTIYSGVSITIPNQGTLSYSGKTFGGWNTQVNGGGTNYLTGAVYTVTGDVTLYAKWQSEIQYTVTYNANGASGATPTAQTVDPETVITLPGAGNMTYPGRVFAGWNVRADGTGDNFDAGASVIILGNVTLYANWDISAVYTVNSSSTFASAITSINSSTKSGTYTIIATASFSCAAVSFTSNAEKTIILQGSGENRILYNNSSNHFFSVPNRITLSLENNITVNGNQKFSSVVRVLSGGTLIMESGSTITGADDGGGVWVNGGMFTMNGGTISDNNNSSFGSSSNPIGGGVSIDNNGVFTLKSGTIIGNSSVNNGPGGVDISNATFNMEGGNIQGNRGYNTNYGGGGVFVRSSTGIFNMSAGTIAYNTSPVRGGGVSSNGTFTMTGGLITGNTCTDGGSGGGVYVTYNGSFTKTGGTIDDTNSARNGKVAYADNGSYIRNSTAGPSDDMDSGIAGTSGGWE